MAKRQTNYVRFRSAAFNFREPKDYFINDCCFGDDVCKWLKKELQAQGIKTDDELTQEDFGWLLEYVVNGKGYWVFVTSNPGEHEDEWLAWITKASMFAELIGRAGKGLAPEAILCIDRILKNSPLISEIEWHFPKGRGGYESEGFPDPVA